jgi:hypothetical protein
MATVQELIDALNSLTDEEKLLPVVIFDEDMEFNNRIKIQICKGTEPTGADDDDDIDINDPEVLLSGGGSVSGIHISRQKDS